MEDPFRAERNFHVFVFADEDLLNNTRIFICGKRHCFLRRREMGIFTRKIKYNFSNEQHNKNHHKWDHNDR